MKSTEELDNLIEVISEAYLTIENDLAFSVEDHPIDRLEPTPEHKSPYDRAVWVMETVCCDIIAAKDARFESLCQLYAIKSPLIQGMTLAEIGKKTNKGKAAASKRVNEIRDKHGIPADSRQEKHNFRARNPARARGLFA